MSPVHANHGTICMRTGALLFNFVQAHKLGEVYDSSTGFRLSPKLLLSPDLSFVSKARLRKLLIAPDKFLCGAPDWPSRSYPPANGCCKFTASLITTSSMARAWCGWSTGRSSR